MKFFQEFLDMVAGLMSTRQMSVQEAIAEANRVLGTSFGEDDFYSGISTFTTGETPYQTPDLGDVAGHTGVEVGTTGIPVAYSIKNFFATHIGKGNSLLGNLQIPNLAQLGRNIRETNLYNGGPTIGQTSAGLMGIYQGGKALKGLYENVNADQDLQSLKNDVSLQIASNPMYDMYMDANDEKLLRQMRNNTMTDGFSNAANGVVRGIPKALLSTLIGGVTGGVGGAALGGIGSLVNSGIEGYGRGTQEATSKLQGLYDRLRQANEEYRTMKRPYGMRTAGLSRSYYNQLY